MIIFEDIELREIPGFPRYYAGSDGEIYSHNFKWKKPTDLPRKLLYGKQTTGYRFVNLPHDKGFRCQRVHVLVCTAFHGKRSSDMQCSHIDGNSQNNKPENLIWESASDNHKRKNEHNTHDKGFNNSRAIFTIDDVLVVKELLNKNIPHEYIADIMNCSSTTISRIANKQRYL